MVTTFKVRGGAGAIERAQNQQVNSVPTRAVFMRQLHAQISAPVVNSFNVSPRLFVAHGAGITYGVTVIDRAHTPARGSHYGLNGLPFAAMIASISFSGPSGF